MPGAPTGCGVKHLDELARSNHGGYGAQAVSVAQIADVSYPKPNNGANTQFGEAFIAAGDARMTAATFDCDVAGEGMAEGRLKRGYGRQGEQYSIRKKAANRSGGGEI
ncbi:MAG: DNA/RNA nuclease SfsA [Deltaproteobacteria bacterium]|nr:DNA/RNA nuclease SfsA [Deltaproteobacteria bacterium]